MNVTEEVLYSMQMRHLKLAISLAFVLSFQCCVRVQVDSNLRSLDKTGARLLSDECLDDLKHRRSEILYNKMEKSFKDGISRAEFEGVLDDFLEEYGAPLTFEYGRETESLKTYASGDEKRLLTLYYDVETTRYARGSHYLSIEIVPDGNGLAVSSVYFGKGHF